ncbi:MAG: translation initiation factor IF-2 [Thermoplasmata archaeon]|nr:translation initiation factor IF-2 [Thermoplasmata archaeon]
MAALRQPILSLLGHVDHGKTTLLDRIAGSVRAEREAGGITQHIGAIEVSKSAIRRLCEGIVDTGPFSVPGLLVIDTPGHRSFETLRRRGGALADLAILVVDVREGMMPQTRESVQILKHEKTPFAVALTKIDLLSGWRKPTGPISLKDQLNRCGPEFVKVLDERQYSLSEELLPFGFSAERYDRVSDFTRNVGIVPVSSKTGVGIAELLALLVGLSQRFLSDELELRAEAAEATILERSEQRGIGPVGSIILYRGRLKVGDDIVGTGRRDVFVTKVRGIYRPAPPTRSGASKGRGLESLNEVGAAAGLYLSAPGVEDALPGGLLRVVHGREETELAKEELTREAHPVAELAESGVALSADTLGSLEALAFECKEASIPIHRAEVGPVDGATVLMMTTVKDPTHRAVLAFNVPVLAEADSGGESGPVRIFRGEVMYRILEEYLAWRSARTETLSEQARVDTIHPAKFQVLPGFVFRASKPAIVGIKVIAGELRPGGRLMGVDGTEVGRLRSLQKESTSVQRAEAGDELAASIEGAVVGRTLQEGDILYVVLTEAAARQFRTSGLSDAERRVLDEVVRIRRRSEPFWGQ